MFLPMLLTQCYWSLLLFSHRCHVRPQFCTRVHCSRTLLHVVAFTSLGLWSNQHQKIPMENWGVLLIRVILSEHTGQLRSRMVIGITSENNHISREHKNWRSSTNYTLSLSLLFSSFDSRSWGSMPMPTRLSYNLVLISDTIIFCWINLQI